MALVTKTVYAVVHDHVDAETPLLDAETLWPSYEHEARKLIREAEEDRE